MFEQNHKCKMKNCNSALFIKPCHIQASTTNVSISQIQIYLDEQNEVKTNKIKFKPTKR